MFIYSAVKKKMIIYYKLKVGMKSNKYNKISEFENVSMIYKNFNLNINMV